MQGRVPAVGRAATLLRLIAETGRPMRIPELAGGTGVPRTTVAGDCAALAAERLLVRGADGSFWLGPRLAELAASARSGRPLGAVVGVLVPNLHNPFFDVEIAALTEIATEQGAELEVGDAAEDPARQRRQLGRLIDAGADVIMINPVAGTGFEAMINKARERDVPVIAIDARTAGVDASVTSDNTQAGAAAGHYLARALGGAGRVGIVDGQPITAMADRVAGFRTALADYPAIMITGRLSGWHDRDSGRACTERLLADGALDGLFVINDLTAYGAADVITERRLPTKIVTVDGSAEAVRQVRGGGPIIATAAQDPARIAREGARLAAALRTGHRLPQSTVLLPTRLITAESWLDYEAWG
ncbi:substrate-binding domain-containing protein [Microlunatus sp. GCM10028923]|uniref:substrate-binding domain-containing protein n=1 Tax=Microlunatus sp. GCM10028923 TaxID=3273400 RepID=UPI00360807FF